MATGHRIERSTAATTVLSLIKPVVGQCICRWTKRQNQQHRYAPTSRSMHCR